ncbi:MAG: hydrolase [Chloroflexi bacterium]|nr:MAG: hydrolase [Chloroflexota bacterium]MBL1195778.1 hydrolase [Chloroflexota bacterium]NOH13069.1 hydrolase [Chloroflexota bacterium]
MSKQTSKQSPNTLRKVLFILLGIAAIPLLLYGYMVASSLIGRETITVDNTDRKYRIYVPSTYQEEPLPLVLVFHMLTASGKTTEWLTGFNEIAEREGFIVVYPEGYKNSWAEGSNLYAADQDQINDVGYISALIDKLMGEYVIDANQIYATGFSSGGLMVQRLGCELSDRISAIASVGATLSTNSFESCNPQQPLPVLMIHGTEDHGVPWQGDSNYLSVPDTIEFWSKHNGCGDILEKTQLPDIKEDGTTVKIDAYTGCLENSSVNLYTIYEGGHTWPGGNQAVQLWGLNGRISQDLNASQTVWAFFQQQGR